MSNNTPYLRHLNTPYQIFSPISSSSYNNPMSTPPKKLNLDFILNKEYDQSNDEEKRRRRSRPVTSASSSSSADVPTLSHNHPDSASHRSTPASSSRSRPSQPSSSRDHSGVPQSARMFQCETCLKTFVERGNLNKHISSVHRKEKNKVCPEPGCGKSFSFRDGLVRHIAHVHKNQRRYACLICDRSFKQASHLAKHMRSIHKEE